MGKKLTHERKGQKERNKKFRMTGYTNRYQVTLEIESLQLHKHPIHSNQIPWRCWILEFFFQDFL